jgi:predicted RNA-binding protein YlxR (DUF448 family)
VGCGRVAPKPALVRLALADDERGQRRRVVLDRPGTLPGRGAYLCAAERGEAPAPDCLARANRRGGLARAFRAAVALAPDFVESTRP